MVLVNATRGSKRGHRTSTSKRNGLWSQVLDLRVLSLSGLRQRPAAVDRCLLWADPGFGRWDMTGAAMACARRAGAIRRTGRRPSGGPQRSEGVRWPGCKPGQGRKRQAVTKQLCDPEALRKPEPGRMRELGGGSWPEMRVWPGCQAMGAERRRPEAKDAHRKRRIAAYRHWVAKPRVRARAMQSIVGAPLVPKHAR